MVRKMEMINISEIISFDKYKYNYDYFTQ